MKPVPLLVVATPSRGTFIDANHPRILTAVRSELLPEGGTVHIRLDPPELGALQVRIEVRDGVVTAAFQTSNDEATRLLSHTLHQLKQSLESTGVMVEKLQVQQTPRERFDSPNDDRQQQRGGGGDEAYHQQQEQQRRELLQRLWRRVKDGPDPFDLVA